MDSNPLITIIVPVYKAEKYLDRCVESVICQTYSRWELLLVDDGSPDRSGELCNMWCARDKRIKAFHKENGGVSTARNFGIDCAVGEWITFVDSDDWVSQNYLEAFVRNLKNEEKVIYLQGIQKFTIHKGLNAMFCYEDSFYSITEQLDSFVNNEILANGCPVAKLFNTKIIKDNDLRFEETITINEDHLFVLTYYNYVDSVCTISNMSYNYYYDFTVPSLTKINHSYEELHRVSLLMHKAYNLLCTKYNLSNYKKHVLTAMFGPNQAAKAILSCLSNKESISSFSLCDDFLVKNFGYVLNRYDIEYRPYIQVLSLNVNIRVKFLGVKFIHFCHNVRNNIKYYLKMILWHNRIKQNKL